jgi:hypothetical protein
MHPEQSQDEPRQLISAVRELNTRWARRALSVWQGHPIDNSPDKFTPALNPC